MNLRSLKGLGLCLAVVAMSGSAPAVAHCHHSHHEHHSDAASYVLRAEIAWNTLVGGLNDIFVAGAFSADPTSAHVDALIAAEQGTTAGSLGEAIANFKTVLLDLHASTTLVTSIGTQIAAVDQAAIDYALSVFTGASGANQLALYNTWTAAGATLGDLLGQLSRGQKDSLILTTISEMITVQGQALQAYFGVLSGVSNQPVAAIALDQEAHEKASFLAAIVVGELFEDRHHHHHCD